MAEKIHKCVSCTTYTMNEKCPNCGEATILPRPPKFSLIDKYAALKREAQKRELIEKGLY
ncbi:ribosome biogenesis protein [Candidatus Woesearchaeota archaeon CG_4_10_14_0_2_um_filter_33_13]|nr:MAG: ribosome biogenesis protein [Candidatus Woesearchaeota archaeon CG_4_10_14_0_2_um_filter_33_13]